MFQIQLINAVVEWEWKLKIEEEKQKNLKGEPTKEFTAAPQPRQEEPKPIFRQVFKHGGAGQPVYCCGAYDQCQEVKPG